MTTNKVITRMAELRERDRIMELLKTAYDTMWKNAGEIIERKTGKTATQKDIGMYRAGLYGILTAIDIINEGAYYEME